MDASFWNWRTLGHGIGLKRKTNAKGVIWAFYQGKLNHRILQAQKDPNRSYIRLTTDQLLDIKLRLYPFLFTCWEMIIVKLLLNLFLNAETILPLLDMLWTSPERLRLNSLSSPGSYQQSDIYSLSIIMHELFERNGPFGVETLQIQPCGEYTCILDNADVTIYLVGQVGLFKSHNYIYLSLWYILIWPLQI